jgi:hypothetical protein
MEVASAIMYIQSGVYFKQDASGVWELKSRGFEPRNHTFGKWYRVLERLPHDETATHTASMRRFGTDPRNQNRFATWYEQQRTANIIADRGKRVHKMSNCKLCVQHATLAEGLHDLVIPIERIQSANHSSSPHFLPWVDKNGRDWEEDFVVTEDGMYSINFDMEGLQ